MEFIMMKGLPVATVHLSFQSNDMLLENVLIDTGCAVTIFDTDEVKPIGLRIKPTSGKAVYMYGVGGRSDVCFGSIKEFLGFSAIIGSDFFSVAKLQIDYSENRIY